MRFRISLVGALILLAGLGLLLASGAAWATPDSAPLGPTVPTRAPGAPEPPVTPQALPATRMAVSTEVPILPYAAHPGSSFPVWFLWPVVGLLLIGMGLYLVKTCPKNP